MSALTTFKDINDPEALKSMLKAETGVNLLQFSVQDRLSRMTEGGVAQVVAQSDGLNKVLVEAEGVCD
jgi:hypothetical protein